MKYNYVCLEKKIIHEERDGWFDWMKKIYIYLKERIMVWINIYVYGRFWWEKNNNNKEVLLLLLMVIND